MAQEFQIKKLTPKDWKLYRDTRLKALQTNPEVYTGKYSDAAAFSDDEWKNRLANNDAATFILFKNENPIGITGIFRMPDKPSTAMCCMSFIEIEFRGQRLSDYFYESRLRWAKNHPDIKRVITGHRDGNEPSRKAMIKHGFKLDHQKVTPWPDGEKAMEFVYVRPANIE